MEDERVWVLSVGALRAPLWVGEWNIVEYCEKEWNIVEYCEKFLHCRILWKILYRSALRAPLWVGEWVLGGRGAPQSLSSHSTVRKKSEI